MLADAADLAREARRLPRRLAPARSGSLETALAAASARFDAARSTDPGAHVALVYALAGQPGAGPTAFSRAFEAQVPEGVRRGGGSGIGRPRLARSHGAAGPHEAVADLRAVVVRAVHLRAAADRGTKASPTSGPVCADSALAAYQPRRRAADRALEKPGRPVGARRPASSVSASCTRPAATGTRALEYYGRFVALWKDADPVLQPAVREVRGRMAALAGEGK